MMIDSDTERRLLTKDFIDVRGIPTCVIKTKPFEEKEINSRSLFIILTGNPGVCDFYNEFMVALYRESNYTVPVWVVSQAGHMIPPREMLHQLGGPYDLEEQVQHKTWFIKDHVPKDKDLVLIGHSIGCHVILEILKLKLFPIQKAILLFPTIERLRETPNAFFLGPASFYFRWAGIAACYLAYQIPDVIKRFLIRLYFGSKVSDSTIQGVCHLFHPQCFDNFSFMGKKELLEIKQVDQDTIASNLEKIIFYYGQTDGWCPVRYYEDMKKRFPKGEVILDDLDMAHAFCLLSSVDMAHVLWGWMKEIK